MQRNDPIDRLSKENVEDRSRTLQSPASYLLYSATNPSKIRCLPRKCSSITTLRAKSFFQIVSCPTIPVLTLSSVSARRPPGRSGLSGGCHARSRPRIRRPRLRRPRPRPRHLLPELCSTQLPPRQGACRPRPWTPRPLLIIPLHSLTACLTLPTPPFSFCFFFTYKNIGCLVLLLFTLIY